MDDAGELARSLRRWRRDREVYFGAGLFGEPGWDLLLDLYIARCEGKTRSTKSADIGATLARPRVLRWLTKLEEAKLVVRRQAHDNDQLTLIALTDEAFERMTEHLERLSRLTRETSRRLS
jgi:DNA-binding transcriptional ArsR family regulator